MQRHKLDNCMERLIYNSFINDCFSGYCKDTAWMYIHIYSCIHLDAHKTTLSRLLFLSLSVLC